MEIKVPALGESVTEATVAKWFKKVGDAVAMDEALCELETDKVTVEVNSTAVGALSEIRVAEGETTQVGAVLCVIAGALVLLSSRSDDAPVGHGPPASATPETSATRAMADVTSHDTGPQGAPAQADKAPLERRLADDRAIVEGVTAFARQRTNWSVYFEDEPQTKMPSLEAWRGDGVIADLDDPAVARVVRRLGIPVVGVIDPGARTAVHATRNGRLGLIGTEATVASGAYDRAVAATGAPVTLRSVACPVFVEHVERGDTTSDELRGAARGYLSPLMADGIDTLIMGCTHYPLLAGLLQLELGPDVVLVSSAEETAKDVYATLVAGNLLRRSTAPPVHAFLSTGDPESFERVAGLFLGPELTAVGAAHAEPAGGGAWS